MSDRCVYMHLTPDENKVFYIGIGSLKRPYVLNPRHRNRYWNKIVEKHGKPKIIIIAKNLTTEEAAEAEKFWIKHHGLDRLANISPGGECLIGSVLSDEHRANIVRTLKGRKHSDETKAKIGDFHRNKFVSTETRIKISKATKNKPKGPFSEDHRRAIASVKFGSRNPMYDATIYNFYHEQHGFVSLTQSEMRKRYNLCDVGLRSLIKGRNKSCKGWRIV